MLINEMMGRIGYEAARADAGGRTFDGRHWPTWDELEELPHGERTRRTWGAGAAAILAEVSRDHEQIFALLALAALGDQLRDHVPAEPCCSCGAALLDEEGR